jgi:hypothetical protein
MLQDRCAGCHNADKHENDLNLTSYASAMRGSENGKVIVPAKPSDSELLRRISLPHDDDEFMPAEGKTPLTERQVAIIRWWIAAGAPNGGAIGKLEVPTETQALLSAELGVPF